MNYRVFGNKKKNLLLFDAVYKKGYIFHFFVRDHQKMGINFIFLFSKG